MKFSIDPWAPAKAEPEAEPDLPSKIANPNEREQTLVPKTCVRMPGLVYGLNIWVDDTEDAVQDARYALVMAVQELYEHTEVAKELRAFGVALEALTNPAVEIRTDQDDSIFVSTDDPARGPQRAIDTLSRAFQQIMLRPGAPTKIIAESGIVPFVKGLTE
jgi:hypothetical protein